MSAKITIIYEITIVSKCFFGISCIKKKKEVPKPILLPCFLKCYFVTLLLSYTKKAFLLRNALVYAKCPVSLWHIVSVRNMKPNAISVPFTNALVKVARQHYVPLPIQAFLPIATFHISRKTEQVIGGANTANRHIQSGTTETRIDV